MQLFNHVVDKNYNKEVMSKENPFVLVFVSKTCPHCRTVEQFITKIEKEYPEVNLYFIESEKSPKLLEKFMVRGFPLTLFINKEKKILHSIVGAGSATDFFKGFDKISSNKKKDKNFFSSFFGG